MTGANLAGLRRPRVLVVLRAYYRGRAVPLLTRAGWRSVLLDDHPVIDVEAECSRDRGVVRVVSVRGDVRAKRIRTAQRQLVSEQGGVLTAPASDVEAEQKLRVPLNRGEDVGVPEALARVLEKGRALFAADKRPDLIALTVGRLDVLHRVNKARPALHTSAPIVHHRLDAKHAA